MSDSFSIKLFLGIHFHGEVKMLLNQSPLWKEAKLLQNQDLKEAQFQDKEYIGYLIDSPLSYAELKQKEKDLKNQLLYYNPKLQVEKHKIYVFSQLLLS